MLSEHVKVQRVHLHNHILVEVRAREVENKLQVSQYTVYASSGTTVNAWEALTNVLSSRTPLSLLIKSPARRLKRLPEVLDETLVVSDVR